MEPVHNVDALRSLRAVYRQQVTRPFRRRAESLRYQW